MRHPLPRPFAPRRGLLAGVGLCALAAGPAPAAAQVCEADAVVDCNLYLQITAGNVNRHSAHACSVDDTYPGAEVIHQVTPPAGQEVVAFFQSYDPEGELDLLVQRDGCGANGTCVGSLAEPASTGEVTWIADGSTYFVTVDNAAALGQYGFTYSLGCPTSCDASHVVQQISCSTNISSTTAGGTSALGYYKCGTPFSHLAQPNPESIYMFIPQQTGEVTFTLDNMTADQDLYVLEGSCDPAACIASSTDLSTNVDSVTFEAQAGTVYYIVVEAFGGPASYDLAFAIGPGGGCVVDCTDNCDHPDCADDVVCCDTDGDGFCEGDCDPDDPTVYPGAPELCDGKDNDCDGIIDEGCEDVAVPDAGPPLTPDAGPPGQAGDAGLDLPAPASSGCGCRTSGANGLSTLALLVLAGLALGAGRRRRPTSME